MEGLAPPVAEWLAHAYGAPTPAQREAVPAVLAGEDLLLASPTGTGKTLAAFLGILSRLHARHEAGALDARTYALYVSPLRALAHDVAVNLQRPLDAIAERLLAKGVTPPAIRVAVRTGDTSQAQRARHLRDPPHVLATTPESLARLLLSPRWEAALGGVEHVVVDEVHALVPTKRGAHLALLLETLDGLVVRRGGRRPARIGLSATIRPLDEAAAYLTGGRPCRVVDVPLPRPLELAIRLHDGDEDALVAWLDARLRPEGTTLVFTNTRAMAESVVAGLRQRGVDVDAEEEASGAAEDEGDSVDPEFALPPPPSRVAPHHGSMSREARFLVEERLRRGELRCVVASSSLELGLHVGSVDHVVLLGSPKSSARALQRLGRSGHHLHGVRRGTLVVFDADDVPEALALATLAAEGDVEPTHTPPGGLDVLAQHVVTQTYATPATRGTIATALRRAWPYRWTADADVDAVLDHLLELRLLRAAPDGRLVATGRARRLVLTGGGAIPRGRDVRVHWGERVVGVLDPDFAASLEEDDTFQLAGDVWRMRGRQPGRLLVSPARGRWPNVPAWRSEGLAMSGRLADATRRIREYDFSLTEVADNEHSVPLSAWVERRRLQTAFSGTPPPEALAFESAPTDDGPRALVFHALVGRRANEALARALARRAEARGVASETGFALLLPRTTRPSLRTVRGWFATPFEEDLRDALAPSDLLRRRFRHVAQRSLLLADADPRLADRDAARLLRDLQDEAPAHFVLREAWREVTEEALDVPAAETLRREVADGTRPLVPLPARPQPSPFAAAILWPPRGPGRGAVADHAERAREWLAHAGGSAPRAPRP